jgi:CubicO group peptidase (beta-lactamase class C family)
MTNSWRCLLLTSLLPVAVSNPSFGQTTQLPNTPAGQQLTQQYTDLLTTAKGSPGNESYAYGFEDITQGGVRSFGHSGGAPGMNGDLRIFPETGYVVVALTNMDRGAQRATSWVTERLPAN